MTGPETTRSGDVQRLQLLVVVGIVAVFFGVSPLAGLAALTLMTVVWPPAVTWRPACAGRVLVVYVPFAIVWLGVTIGYLQVMHASGSPVSPQSGLEQLAREGIEHPQFALNVISIVVLAPVFEEIVFRGYLFGALRTLLPSVASQLLVAVLFGLAHTLDYAFPIGVLALLFGWLRARYNSLLPSILAHAVHNGLTVALTLLWPGLLELMYPR